MSDVRLKYGVLAPEGLAKLRELEHYLKMGRDRGFVAGVGRLRVSLVNGCELCVRFHSGELKKVNETAERIAGLEDWRSRKFFRSGRGRRWRGLRR